MFDWLRSKCPVSSAAKEWIEKRMDWLTREFGPERLRDVTVILPTEEFFPDPYNGSKRDACTLFKRVCQYMDVDPNRVQLFFYTERRPGWEGQHQGSAGLYAAGSVHIEQGNLQDPLALVGTMAHELAHVHLLGDGRISDQEEDHEALTDLLTVFLGLGIFTANSVLREVNWNAGQVSGWSMSRRCYLTMDMYGYAFALLAWFRGEESPAWARHLRGDVHAAFKKGLRYLTATGDARFKPLHLP
jgi:hypothetical protein